MKDWQEEYQRKLVTAEQAVAVVKSGDVVAIPIGGDPPALAGALAKRNGELRDVGILTCAAATDPGWFQPGWQDSFRIYADVFVGAVARQAMDDRRIDYMPFLFSLHGKAEREGRPVPHPIDVVMVGVSPPDKHGYCSFGVGLWNKKSYARQARYVLAEVNANYIRTGGDNFIHVSAVSHFVENTLPRNPVPQVAPEPHTKQIGKYVETLIRDGNTIQIGTGTATSPLGRLGVFDDKLDLGWHSEITPPGIVKLIRAGVINGKRKTIHKDRAVATTFGGDDEDFAFMDGNPTFELYEVEYVNNMRTIAAHDNMVAINNAITVDLTGQICSESIGARIFNGSGGQPEFSIGAMLSKGGRSITCLPSTTGGGSVSRIVPFLDPGTSVTVPRSFADYVVTEYGIASLLGKSQRERAAELISIAHPDHRSELREIATTLFWE